MITKNRVEVVAAAIHAAWYAFAVLAGGETGKPWADLTDDEKESSRATARFFLGLNESGLDTSLWPEMAHSNWLVQKSKGGWKYGAVKDSEAKTHPCMVPYSALSEIDKTKDLVTVQAAAGVIVALMH